MPPGATPETVDGMALEQIAARIDAVRQERYRGTPGRRTSLPTWSDTRLQEVIRLLLEAAYEPQCRPHAHGLRHGRGGQTALGESAASWRGVQWCLEGDMAPCFDRLHHEGRLSIRGTGRHEKRWRRVLATLVPAGFREGGRFHATLSGAPHGGVVRPILRLMSLDRVAQCGATRRRPASHRAERRKPCPPSRALRKAARTTRLVGALQAARVRRKQAQTRPARAPTDAPCRRVGYVRYAAAWLRGCSGPREKAEAITEHRNECRRAPLPRPLASEQTLSPNARTQSARFLGDAVRPQDAHDQQGHAQHRRSLNGAPGLPIPADGLRAQGAQYRRHGVPTPWAARRNETDDRRVTQYQGEERGFVPYALMAYNAHRLWRVQRVMPRSLVFTLAEQHRPSAPQIVRKSKAAVTTAHGTRKGREVTPARGTDKQPRCARVGGSARRWQQRSTRNDQPKAVLGHRRAVLHRCRARCGVASRCDVLAARATLTTSSDEEITVGSGSGIKPLWSWVGARAEGFPIVIHGVRSLNVGSP